MAIDPITRVERSLFAMGMLAIFNCAFAFGSLLFCIAKPEVAPVLLVITTLPVICGTAGMIIWEATHYDVRREFTALLK